MPFGCPNVCPEYAADGLCICPAGCSGKGQFKFWEDSCHVNDNLETGLSIISLILSSIALVASIFALYETGIPSELVRVYDYARETFQSYCQSRGSSEERSSERKSNKSWDDSTVDSFTRPALGTQASSTFRGTHIARALRLHIERQHLLDFWLLVCVCIFAVCIVVAEALMSGGVYKWQPRYPARDLLEACYAIAGSALIISGHIVSYKWYQSLPSIRRYGALFGINPFLVRYPFVLKAITLFSSVASVVCLVTFILVLPIVEPERTETWTVATLGTLCGAVLSWGFNITYLTHLLLRIYRSAKWTILRRSTLDVHVHSLSSQGIHFGRAGRVALSIAKDSNEPDAVIYREFRSMRTILYGVLIMVGSGTVVISVLLLGSIFVLEMRESLYITFSLVVICCELGALGLIYFAVFRTSERFQGCWPVCVCTKEPESSSVDAFDDVAPVS